MARPANTLSIDDWQQLQREDENLASVKDMLTSDLDSDTIDKHIEQPEVVLLLREKSKLILVDGVLYRRVLDQRGEAFHQLVIPSGLREVLLAKDGSDIEEKCKTCERCVKRKARAQRAAKLVNIKVSAPLELICIDFLTLEPNSRDTGHN